MRSKSESSEFFSGWSGSQQEHTYNSWLMELVAKTLFTPGSALIDLGCGRRGRFVRTLRKCGVEAFGVDYKVPDSPFFSAGDMRETPYRVFDHAASLNVLYYFSRKDLPDALGWIGKWFSQSAILYASPHDMEVDDGAECIHSAEYLRNACEQIGGNAAVLRFQDESWRLFGPSVLWTKWSDDRFASECLKISRAFRKQLQSFSVSI